MRTSKLFSLLMAFLLSVGLLGSAFAEESTLVPADAAVEETVFYVQPTAQTEQTPATDANPTQSPASYEAAALVDDAAPGLEATATPNTTDTPEAMVEPTPEATAETPSVPQSTEVPAQTPVQSVNVHMQVPQNLQYGDEITLTATMTGFENTNYAVRWQFTRDGQTWQDADGSGADSTTFRFAVSDQNVGTGWRLAVTTW